jgi:hypothetical protein
VGVRLVAGVKVVRVRKTANDVSFNALVYWSCQILYISILTHRNDLQSSQIETRQFHHRLGVRVWESFSV